MLYNFYSFLLQKRIPFLVIHSPDIKKVKRHYKIPVNARIILYAPTYRYAASPVILEADDLLERLEQDGSKKSLQSPTIPAYFQSYKKATFPDLHKILFFPYILISGILWSVY